MVGMKQYLNCPLSFTIGMHRFWCFVYISINSRVGWRTFRLLLLYLSRSQKGIVVTGLKKSMATMSRPLGSREQDPSELNVDRISSLPWGILDNIFGKMTIVDAVKTSVLAKDWRFKWLSHSDFSLDSNALAGLLNPRDLTWDVIASIVNKFLLHHTSRIRSFSLKTCCDKHHPDVYQWIQYLSTQDVEVLVIEELTKRAFFRMPSYLFSFQNLKSLSLINCALRIPSTFESFRLLEELFLKDLSICDADLAKLLSCPLLDKLTLLNINGLTQLIIKAPRLTGLTIDIGYQNMHIEAASSVAVSIVVTYREPGGKTNWQNVFRCFSILGSIGNLSLTGVFIQIMAADYGRIYLPLKNCAVSSLTLKDIRFDKVEVLMVCLSLCVNIKHLRLYIESAKGAEMAVDFFEKIQGRLSFPTLETITVICPFQIGLGCAVTFIDFVISHSPNLKFLTIEKERDIGMYHSRVSKMLRRFRRKCPQATIVYKLDGRLCLL